MLQIAANWIEQEKKDIEEAKEAYMAENCPTPDVSGDQAALMVGTGVEGEGQSFQQTLGIKNRKFKSCF